MTRIASVTAMLFLATTLACPRAAMGEDDLRLPDVRIAFELEGKHVVVRQMVTIKQNKAETQEDKGVRIPLPQGAVHPGFPTDRPNENITLEDDAVVVNGEIPEEGRGVAVVYELPIRDGTVQFDQSLGMPIQLVHAAFVGEADTVRMSGPGFGGTERRAFSSDLPALFMVGQNFEQGRIRITVTGFEANPFPIIVRLVTGLSSGILAVGFFLWLRRKRRA